MNQAIKLPVRYSKTPPYQRKKVREQYIKEQEGLCYWCKSSLAARAPKEITDLEIDWSKFPENFLNYPIHLQHDHDSDLTEGAVHAYCNAVMWQHHGR